MGQLASKVSHTADSMEVDELCSEEEWIQEAHAHNKVDMKACSLELVWIGIPESKRADGECCAGLDRALFADNLEEAAPRKLLDCRQNGKVSFEEGPAAELVCLRVVVL